ncbi:Dipeptidyl aminopeptidase/acylaminoacyl peptidase [Microbulbifer donghaiensis]|uniref:Dipeptidyl aminopeptidase/acylaminoacyl peptidase n=1 Tax=Microbulbifer donghaiensis TaxID=494016 RepID=A0A1M4ZTX5_9GAMM|nr:S9 family peptidase [Microbulbifer donghaiensis]SHF21444.1 Dipeptidyl aminopeptidase/acylaminoacyl peptidase [Microbulbifer donghaiensis]
MKKPSGFLGVISLFVLVTACGPKNESTADIATGAENNAQQVALIDRELLFGNPDRFQGRLSPDGQMMSFLAPLDGVMNVWVAPAGKIEAAEPLTNDTGRGIQQHFWAQDSKHLLYRQDKNGDENWHLYSIDLLSRKIVDLSPYEGVQAQMIAQSETQPGVVVIGMNDRDARWHDLYKVNLKTASRELILENDGFATFYLDNELQLRLATESTPSGGFNVFEWRDEEWLQLFEIPVADTFTTQILGFDAANSGIYLLDSRDRDKAALVYMDLTSGDTDTLAESQQADISKVFFHPRNHEPIAYSVNVHTNQWTALEEEYTDAFSALNSKVMGDFDILASTLDASKWVLYTDSGNASPVYQVFQRENNALEKLFVTNPKLADLALAKTYSHTIRSRDGMDLVSYLTLPRDADENGGVAQPVPMVLLVHGGPWGRDNFGYSGIVQWLANRGYAVLQVNFRSSTGFGKSFLNAGNGEWAGAMHNDLIDAVDWAIKQGVTSTDKVAIMGGSYGGYATLVGLTFTPEKFACGVDIVGPSNLNTLLDSIPPYWESFRNTLHAAVGNPNTEEGKKLLQERSPLNHVDRIVRPLLIGQGANDPRVKQAESDQIVAAMKAKGIPMTYILYPDEGHGFRKPENNLSFFAASEAFLADCIGGRYQPLGDDLADSSIQVVHGAEFVPGLGPALEQAKVIATKMETAE